MQDPCVRDVLGTVKTIERAQPELFHTVLQGYVDSMAKATAGFLEKAEKREIEFWPLIKVVRVYTKATALSTGTVVVDLPGVHDSNKARATIAEDYLKQCSGEFQGHVSIFRADIRRSLDRQPHQPRC